MLVIIYAQVCPLVEHKITPLAPLAEQVELWIINWSLHGHLAEEEGSGVRRELNQKRRKHDKVKVSAREWSEFRLGLLYQVRRLLGARERHRARPRRSQARPGARCWLVAAGQHILFGVRCSLSASVRYSVVTEQQVLLPEEERQRGLRPLQALRATQSDPEWDRGYSNYAVLGMHLDQ
jgi:hypothetical protein